MMNNRRRFWKTMHFEPVDRLPFWSDWLGPWQAWQHQGLPLTKPFNLDSFEEQRACTGPDNSPGTLSCQ